MIKYLQEDEWKVIEKGFHPEYQRGTESIFSIGNGQFGQRANFEEHYSGDSMQGSYIAGVYYPDKTKVGWWKNGYPEYFAKVLNSVNWIGIRLMFNGEEIDLAKNEVKDFERILDMQKGILSRTCTVGLSNGATIQLTSRRFCSMANSDVAGIEMEAKVIEGEGDLKVISYLDANVQNEDKNWDDTFWDQIDASSSNQTLIVRSETKKTAFQVSAAAVTTSQTDGAESVMEGAYSSKEGYAQVEGSFSLSAGKSVTLRKYVSILSNRNHDNDALNAKASTIAAAAKEEGYAALEQAHIDAWAKIWEMGDIRIEGDVAAQQGIRFNIFHLNQTYTGEDDRLNIGPKGFTGEKYGGSTYWDTEAYCLPFYLNTHEEHVAEQLLVYRYKHLEKAIENAEKLGFTNGAALYPMVTMNGEECHNEWEITFEEIHRNGAIAYAIYNYVRHTGNADYLAKYGFDVLLGIARFWAQRVNWSEDKQQYVMLGVTGPNEYENNVNNNWYTNYLAQWCMNYTLKTILYLKQQHADAYAEKVKKWNFDEATETAKWADIIEKMYLPQMEGSDIVLQQDGFLDKEQLSVDDLAADERPINQKWSWDRILRSIFIKQADVLQGFYFFEDHFSDEQHKANFDFYEPKTLHESSLSPCVHVVLAAKLGMEEKAYEMYLRTSRLDLDDYNKEAYQGLHITSMAGTWLSVVEGFGGLRVRKDVLHLNPMLPKQWRKFSFKVVFRKRELQVVVSTEGTKVELLKGDPLEIMVSGEPVSVS